MSDPTAPGYNGLNTLADADAWVAALNADLPPSDAVTTVIPAILAEDDAEPILSEFIPAEIPADIKKGVNALNLRENPKARQILYAVAFIAAAGSLFAPLMHGELGATLQVALTNLSALATAASSTTALANLSRPSSSPESGEIQ